MTEELFTLRSQRAEASQKVAHLDVEVSELRMAADSAKVSLASYLWFSLIWCLDSSMKKEASRR